LWPVFDEVGRHFTAHILSSPAERLIFVSSTPRIRIYSSATQMFELRPLWEAICAGHPHTVFQNFDLNLLAATAFAEREEPFIVAAEASYGSAIIPAVIHRGENSLRLLGEELFDYRCFLHQGDPEILNSALAVLVEQGLPLNITALRKSACGLLEEALPLLPFCSAPAVSCADISADDFATAHLRLARNLRRLNRLGFTLHCYHDDYPGLVRFIYERKAGQTPGNLFQDRSRIEFMVQAAALLRDQFEIYTLEDEASIAAAAVILREKNCRRFYTGWFSPRLEKHSPALSLIYEVTRQSLAAGLDCDYMTGEQPYKLRLATRSEPLYRVQATAKHLAGLRHEPAVELTQAA
jgi:CelD/BcsL family acetyltransferase involved in cellulose biosynthesis